MQFALLVYESPEDFATRKSDETDHYTGAWRSYYKSMIEAGVYVGGDPLEAPETGTTVRIQEGKRRVQDGPYADTKEQLGGFVILELASLDEALDWAARCPTASAGAVEIRPLARAAKLRITESMEVGRRTCIERSSAWPASRTAGWWPTLPLTRATWPAPKTP
jgi:hypothetical protein